MVQQENSTVTRNIIFGSASGMIVGVILQPLDIIKSQIIINPQKSQEIQQANIFRGMQISSQFIYQKEGIRGFWRGTDIMVLKLMTSSAIFYTSLHELQKIFKYYDQSSLSDFFSAFFSRIISALLSNPMQVVRTRVEVIGFNEYQNPFDGLIKVYKLEGLEGLKSGSLTTILREGPFAGIYFLLYKQMKIFGSQYQPILGYNGISLISGIIAGLIATTITNPIDVVRTRIQFRKSSDQEKYKSISDGFKQIYNNEGLKGFSRGLAPRLMRKPLTNSFSFLIFESLQRLINKSYTI